MKIETISENLLVAYYINNIIKNEFIIILLITLLLLPDPSREFAHRFLATRTRRCFKAIACPLRNYTTISLLQLTTILFNSYEESLSRFLNC